MSGTPISNFPSTNLSNTTNLIEEFFNISEEDQKLINFLKEEFQSYKFFSYGSIVYIQKEDEDEEMKEEESINFNNNENSEFPHVTELLENYEKIYSKACYLNHLVLRLTKCTY
jgi:hypothetical protein